MQAGRLATVAVVTAAVEHDRRDTGAARGGEDPPVALGDGVVVQRHLAEAVVAMDIGAGVPEDQPGAGAMERLLERRREGGEVFRSLDAARQRHIEIPRLLGRRVIATDVDRVREATRDAAQEGMGAVALVRVGVDDEDAQPGVLGRQRGAGHGDVVQDAETEAAGGEGMVGAAAEVGGQPVRERGSGGEEGALGLAAAAVEQPGVVGQAQAVAVGVG